MPRIPYSLLLRARRIDPLLPPLLQECRDLCSAKNELRWLTEYARSHGTSREAWSWRQRLQSLVCQRAAGKPLQYILGDQPFGELTILCREGVLIPRLDTESYTTRIAQRLLAENRHNPTRSLRIIDICTGTGCIPLLLHSLLAPSIPTLSIIGVDISSTALSLAKKNLEYNIGNGSLLSRARDEVRFVHADILDPCSLKPDGSELGTLLSRSGQDHSDRLDLLISNPPYISPREFANGTTRRSVRLYEPALALVPPPIRHVDISSESARADSFYPRLLDISAQLDARFTVLECGDPAQARRVATMVDDKGQNPPLQFQGDVKTEVWRCDWDAYSHNTSGNIASDDQGESATVDVTAKPDQGARAVVLSKC
ncbi:mitochondrial N(5)-glutamine methyltransferase MTQ1 [Nannizzia gypsea CBS 118893]|uniref:Mitochondrial N(5)-glutamine methyltransferase MTQ1 n=1 Tax=Arthroderma gypseum (strain ATCC MYA-4604 / CBS 118893) TaxID=535722 RepID=E4UZ95_ARTGP|nr:mitochondrial N(5)-glutamine methyltransferase MTQ1 [Nannizzia gypsea CBS 118893]EFR03425.1 mitochondrial N(5)-glutamine methyltransferase MTQ1 [Nannizzia gypsea CBS 118893]